MRPQLDIKLFVGGTALEDDPESGEAEASHAPPTLRDSLAGADRVGESWVVLKKEVDSGTVREESTVRGKGKRGVEPSEGDAKGSSGAGRILRADLLVCLRQEVHPRYKS